MLLTASRQVNVARTDLYDFFTSRLITADSIDDVPRLTALVGVPGTPSTRCERHLGNTDGGVLSRSDNAIDPRVAREPPNWPLGGCLVVLYCRGLTSSLGTIARLVISVMRGCCRPTDEQVQRLLGRTTRLGAVDEDSLPGVAQQIQCLVVEDDGAHYGVMKCLGSGSVEPHVVRRPAHAEFLALGGEFADELGQFLVIRVATGFSAKNRDDVIGDCPPIGEETDCVWF